jgi:hypothetical protein
MADIIKDNTLQALEHMAIGFDSVTKDTYIRVVKVTGNDSNDKNALSCGNSISDEILKRSVFTITLSGKVAYKIREFAAPTV